MRDIGDALRIEALSVKKNINYAVKNYYDTSSKAGKEYELLLLNEKINGYIEDFYVFALEKAAINDADFKDYGKISMRSLQKDITEAITKYSGKNYSLDGILNWVNRIFDKGTESFINKVQDKVQEKEIKAALYLASLKGYENYLFSTASSGACKKCQALNGSILRISGAETGINLPPMHPNCKCDIITGNDSFLAEESQKIVKGALVSQDKNSKAKEPLLSKKELIGFLKEMLPAEDLFFFYNPTETYISKEEIRKELKEAPEYTEELYRRYADKLIVEQMFEKEPLTDAAVQKMDFLLNYDMFKILPDIEEACCIRYIRIP